MPFFVQVLQQEPEQLQIFHSSGPLSNSHISSELPAWGARLVLAWPLGRAGQGRGSLAGLARAGEA